MTKTQPYRNETIHVKRFSVAVLQALVSFQRLEAPDERQITRNGSSEYWLFSLPSPWPCGNVCAFPKLTNYNGQWQVARNIGRELPDCTHADNFQDSRNFKTLAAALRYGWKLAKKATVEGR